MTAKPVDLRSDTVTVPSDEMRRAMMSADVGDDVYGEDPTVNRLQDELAAMLGMEAGLFVASGTMSNQVALKTHTQPGDEVLGHRGGRAGTCREIHREHRALSLDIQDTALCEKIHPTPVNGRLDSQRNTYLFTYTPRKLKWGSGQVDFTCRSIKETCYDIDDLKTKKRELKGLINGMNHFNLKSGTIITWDHEDTEKIEGKMIKFVPLWKWLLE